MSNQSDKIQLGATLSSFKTVDNVPGSIAAGKVVFQHASNVYNTTASGGTAYGISLGIDQSDIGRTAVCRRGVGVPVVLTAMYTPVTGEQLQVHATTGAAVASAGTALNASFSSVNQSALNEDGTASTLEAAYVDFPGGL